MISFNQIHDEITRIVDALTQGGGGGSTVSVVSKRNTGENIADITVNNTTTQLYAPDSASDISFDPTVKGVYSGTNTQSVVDEITDDISSLNDTTTKLTTKTILGTVTASNQTINLSDSVNNYKIIEIKLYNQGTYPYTSNLLIPVCNIALSTSHHYVASMFYTTSIYISAIFDFPSYSQFKLIDVQMGSWAFGKIEVIGYK